MTMREELIGKVARGIMEEHHVRRFWSKIDQSDPDGCWLWTAKSNVRGYGAFKLGINFRAHRIAYILTNAPIPDGLIIRHKCDVRGCCNPKHLEPGTYYDNMQDRRERGRANARRGEDHAQAKLTDKLVLAIRQNAASGRTFEQTETDLGVSKCDVLMAIYRWKHLPMPPGIRRKTTQEVRDKACALVQGGMTQRKAAKELGVSQKTIWRALNKQAMLKPLKGE